MMDNVRFFFSMAWFVATGCLFATGLVNIVTWGGYIDYFYWALLAWGVVTVGTIYTSL